jgi:hypothetical protein
VIKLPFPRHGWVESYGYLVDGESITGFEVHPWSRRIIIFEIDGVGGVVVDVGTWVKPLAGATAESLRSISDTITGPLSLAAVCALVPAGTCHDQRSQGGSG